MRTTGEWRGGAVELMSEMFGIYEVRSKGAEREGPADDVLGGLCVCICVCVCVKYGEEIGRRKNRVRRGMAAVADQWLREGKARVLRRTLNPEEFALHSGRVEGPTRL